MADQPESQDQSEVSAQSEDERKEELLEEAKAHFKTAQEYWKPIFDDWLDDVRFANGAQWPSDIQKQREEKGRPCLVINRLPQFIQQVTNDQRQNRPSIKVHPVDDGADVETAKAIQGLIRHIEYDSNADAAYDTAVDGTVKGGLGFIRVVTEYSDDLSFDLNVLIKRVSSPVSVLLDPSFKNSDGSDAEYGFVFDVMSKDAFKRAHPKAELVQASEWEHFEQSEPEWVKKDGVRIAEYFYKEYEDKIIHLLSDGNTVADDELEEHVSKLAKEHVGQGNPLETLQVPEIKQTKTAKVAVVKWCKLTANEVLEETTWPGKYIPIVPVLGAEQEIDGKRILKGIVRDAKDAQRMLNYWKSAETEAIALAPRAPFIAAAGQIEDFEKDWKSANRENHAVLLYNPISAAGTLVGAPQRHVAEPAVHAITQAAMFAADDLKATTGIYDAALGAKSNETSGIAIQRRNNQAQTSNFHFMDNLTRSLRQVGRILVDLIPHIYDTERAARIIGDDGDQKVVTINASQPVEGQVGKDGKPLLYDLSAGEYDVTIDVGPSYASKRQEAAAAMIELSKSIPAIGQAAPDLILKSLDVPGAAEMAERLKKTLPPNLIDDGKPQPIPPQAQAQMQQMNQMIEQLTAQLHQAHDVIDHKREELESKERIEMAKLENQATIELAKLQSNEALGLLSHQIAELDARTKMLGMNEPIESDSQDFAPNQGGAQGAAPTQGPEPTGGESPGLPMEGQ